MHTLLRRDSCAAWKMPMRLEIYLQREIARLHFYELSSSDRTIADTVGISPTTVGVLRNKLRATTLNWSDIQDLDDAQWRTLIGTHDRSVAAPKPAPNWEWVHQEMQAEDATLEHIWQEWRESEPTGIGYTQFTSGYRKYIKKLHIVMRRVHLPGDKLFVDFAGRTIDVHDAETGAIEEAQIFIGVLGYSNYTFIYAVPSQKTADWVDCHIKCFEYMGGAPAWVVSDNLKAAVWRRERDRIVVNPSYRDCLAHYGTAARPTRSRKPKDKPKAEVGVQIAQRLFFRLRNRKFFSFDELNTELYALSEKLNHHRFKKLDGCRHQWMEDTEREKLRPLPERPFELCDWKYQVRIGQDYHVEHQGAFYSVPYYLAGNRVDLRFTQTILEIFLAGRRIAMHLVQAKQGATVTEREHRPLSHIAVTESEPADLIRWAEGIGPSANKMIAYHLHDRRDPTNGLRAAQRMRSLARTYGDERFEAVCTYALKSNITSLRNVESIFKTNADLRPAKPQNSEPRPTHGNVRGPEYFGE
ncbi:transposase [Herbaspirillum sp. SJZ130]|nr:transposase [Herbaspirillum sp. SJZ130]TQK05718.1 transposase [Herbaspirillum sp. SJZ106]TWC63254.1 transposase [Herbaspirillum sp. SJZ099]